MIYIILGMHKSGTTMISQILHKSGINMGEFDESVSYDQGNQYEHQSCQAINLEILGCGNAHSLDVIKPVGSLPENSNVHSMIKKFAVSQDQLYAHWGFKDPRSCLSYLVWNKLLPEHKVIYVYRPPLELWHHYRKYIPKRKFFGRVKEGYRALCAWYIYNSQILEYITKQDKPYHILEFSSFMALPSELERFGQFIGHKLTDCRKANLYRSKPKPDFIYLICLLLLRNRTRMDVNQLYTSLEEERRKI